MPSTSTDGTDRELRIISVTATVSPHINEKAMAEVIQQELRDNSLFEGSAIEFGTVDVYEHKAHSGSPEDTETDHSGGDQ